MDQLRRDDEWRVGGVRNITDVPSIRGDLGISGRVIEVTRLVSVAQQRFQSP